MTEFLLAILTGVLATFIVNLIFKSKLRRSLLKFILSGHWVSQSSEYPIDIENYLRKFIERMKSRNRAWSDPFMNVFIDPETSSIESNDDGKYYGEIGHIISLPEKHTKVLERSQAYNTNRIWSLKERPIRNIIKKLENTSKTVVLLGEPGSGKSTILRELAIKTANEALRNGKSPIPVYVDLGSFSTVLPENENLGIIELIRESIDPGVVNLKSQINVGVIKVPLIILFDGLDEIPRNGDYFKKVQALSQFAEDYSAIVTCIFTCRTNHFDPNFVHSQLVIQPFSDHKIKQYIKTTLGRKVQIEGELITIQNVMSTLQNFEGLGTSIRNPLTLSIMVYFIKSNCKWPAGSVSLYDNFLVKLAQIGLSRELKQEVSDLEIINLVNQWSEMAYEIFGLSASVFLNLNHSKTSSNEGAIRLAISSGLLWMNNSNSEARFVHQRIQEYLVARKLYHTKASKIRWSDIINIPRWQETLIYFFNIGGENNDIINILNDQFESARFFFEKIEDRYKEIDQRLAGIEEELSMIPTYVKAMTESGMHYDYVPEYKEHANQLEAETFHLEVERDQELPETRLPIHDERDWIHFLVFVGRLVPYLKGNYDERGIIEKFKDMANKFMVFGRPNAKILLLEIWKLNARLLGNEMLETALRTKSAWVQSHVIKTLISSPLSNSHSNFHFLNQLMFAILNFDLWSNFRGFQRLAVQNSRKIQLIFACILSAAFNSLIIFILLLAGYYITEIINLKINIFSSFKNPVTGNLLVWFALVNLGTIISTPRYNTPYLMRLNFSNSIFSGILIVFWNQGISVFSPARLVWLADLSGIWLALIPTALVNLSLIVVIGTISLGYKIASPTNEITAYDNFSISKSKSLDHARFTLLATVSVLLIIVLLKFLFHYSFFTACVGGILSIPVLIMVVVYALNSVNRTFDFVNTRIKLKRSRESNVVINSIEDWINNFEHSTSAQKEHLLNHFDYTISSKNPKFFLEELVKFERSIDDYLNDSFYKVIFNVQERIRLECSKIE